MSEEKLLPVAFEGGMGPSIDDLDVLEDEIDAAGTISIFNHKLKNITEETELANIEFRKLQLNKLTTPVYDHSTKIVNTAIEKYNNTLTEHGMMVDSKIMISSGLVDKEQAKFIEWLQLDDETPYRHNFDEGRGTFDEYRKTPNTKFTPPGSYSKIIARLVFIRMPPTKENPTEGLHLMSKPTYHLANTLSGMLSPISIINPEALPSLGLQSPVLQMAAMGMRHAIPHILDKISTPRSKTLTPVERYLAESDSTTLSFQAMLYCIMQSNMALLAQDIITEFCSVLRGGFVDLHRGNWRTKSFNPLSYLPMMKDGKKDEFLRSPIHVLQERLFNESATNKTNFCGNPLIIIPDFKFIEKYCENRRSNQNSSCDLFQVFQELAGEDDAVTTNNQVLGYRTLTDDSYPTCFSYHLITMSRKCKSGLTDKPITILIMLMTTLMPKLFKAYEEMGRDTFKNWWMEFGKQMLYGLVCTTMNKQLKRYHISFFADSPQDLSNYARSNFYYQPPTDEDGCELNYAVIPVTIDPKTTLPDYKAINSTEDLISFHH
jgi:hypothetical protein